MAISTPLIDIRDIDLKKNYKFIWLIEPNINVSVSSLKSSIKSSKLDFIKELLRQALNLLLQMYAPYVSLLTKSVSVPEDRVDISAIAIGLTDMYVPNKIVMNDIKVVYYDDSMNNVYNFHRTWRDYIRNGDSMSFVPMKSVCASALFTTYEDILTASEYATLIGFPSRLENGTVDTVMNKIVKSNFKPTSVTKYPFIYPYSIVRSEASRDSEDLHTVTVTYKRLPNVNRTKPYVCYSPKDIYQGTDIF